MDSPFGGFLPDEVAQADRLSQACGKCCFVCYPLTVIVDDAGWQQDGGGSRSLEYGARRGDRFEVGFLESCCG